MSTKPQDVLVALKLLDEKNVRLSYKELAASLGMSVSETHQAVRRAQVAGLISPITRQANRTAVAELLIHGLKYMFPVQPDKRARGLATGFAAPPLLESFRDSAESGLDILVWPDAEGENAGWSIHPLTRSVPYAARQDAQLYEWLVLVDALRGAGRARERKLAEAMVRERLNYHAPC